MPRGKSSYIISPSRKRKRNARSDANERVNERVNIVITPAVSPVRQPRQFRQSSMEEIERLFPYISFESEEAFPPTGWANRSQSFQGSRQGSQHEFHDNLPMTSPMISPILPSRPVEMVDFVPTQPRFDRDSPGFSRIVPTQDFYFDADAYEPVPPETPSPTRKRRRRKT